MKPYCMLCMMLFTASLLAQNTETTNTTHQQNKSTKEEDKATTQAATSGFLGVAENIIKIIQNSDDPKELSSGAQGIVSSFLHIIAATKNVAKKVPPYNVEKAFLEQLYAAVVQQLAIKEQDSVQKNNTHGEDVA